MSKKAYLYLRLSSPQQIAGDSRRRQIAKAEEYCRDRNLDLQHDHYDDIAVSAFRGKNRQTGAFSKLIDDIKTSVIEPGSYVMVESLDRVSREVIRKSIRAYLDLIDMGVTIVTLTDRVAHHADDDDLPMKLFGSLMVLQRAHEESDTKSGRVKAAWTQKRKAAGIMTTRAPGWLVAKPDRSGFDTIPERVAIVERIFAECAQGLGRFKIASRLNDKNVEPFRKPKGKEKGWYDATIRQIIESDAVLGILQPHEIRDGKRVPVGVTIPNYYPQILSETLVEQARAAMRGRAGKGGPKGRTFSNLLTGFAYCSECGAKMTLRNRGRGHLSLTCSGAMRGHRCTIRTNHPYPALEEAVLTSVRGVDLSAAFPAEREPLIERRAQLKRMAAAKELRIVDMSKDYVESASRTVYALIRQTEQDIDTLKAELVEVEREIGKLRGDGDAKSREAMLTKLREVVTGGGSEAEVYQARAHVHESLRAVIDQVQCYPDGEVHVIIAGGLAGYQIKNGQVVTYFDHAGLIKSGEWSGASFPSVAGRMQKYVKAGS